MDNDDFWIGGDGERHFTDKVKEIIYKNKNLNIKKWPKKSKI